MFGWIHRLRQRLRPAPPALGQVTFDAEVLSYRAPDGQESYLRWQDLEIIAIETTDLGPFIDDLFWVLRAQDGTSLAVPSQSTGTTDLVERLQQLKDFDNLAMIEALGSTDRQVFICWKRG